MQKNNSVITLKSLVIHLWQDIINFFIFSFTKAKSIEAKKIKQEGILVVENFISTTETQKIKNKIDQILSKKEGSGTLPSGTKIVHRGTNTGTEADEGMIDIFHLENEFPDLNQKVKYQEIGKLLSEAFPQPIIYTSAHAYINKGISQTRGFHIDSSQPILYKAFIYLTDVPTPNYGAYCFIKKSHKFCSHIYYNFILNFFSKSTPTQAPTYNKSNIYPITGKKGTLIISSQNAIHRGMPQDNDKERYAIVLNFFAPSKFNFLAKDLKQKLKNGIVITS